MTTSRPGRHGMGRHSGSDGLTGHIAALPPPDGSGAPADLKNTAPVENTAQVKNTAPVKNPAPAGADKTPETRASPAALPAGQTSDPAAGTYHVPRTRFGWGARLHKAHRQVRHRHRRGDVYGHAWHGAAAARYRRTGAGVLRTGGQVFLVGQPPSSCALRTTPRPRHLALYLETLRHLALYLKTSRHLALHPKTSRHLALYLKTLKIPRHLALHSTGSRHLALHSTGLRYLALRRTRLSGQTHG